MGIYGKETSNDISSETTEQIQSRKFIHTPRGVSIKVVKGIVEFYIINITDVRHSLAIRLLAHHPQKRKSLANTSSRRLKHFIRRKTSK